jgi:hypothetical protein
MEEVVCSGLFHHPMNHLVCIVVDNKATEEQRNIKLVQIVECVVCNSHFIHKLAICFGVNVQAIRDRVSAIACCRLLITSCFGVNVQAVRYRVSAIACCRLLRCENCLILRRTANIQHQ